MLILKGVGGALPQDDSIADGAKEVGGALHREDSIIAETRGVVPRHPEDGTWEVARGVATSITSSSSAGAMVALLD